MEKLCARMFKYLKRVDWRKIHFYDETNVGSKNCSTTTLNLNFTVRAHINFKKKKNGLQRLYYTNKCSSFKIPNIKFNTSAHQEKRFV